MAVDRSRIPALGPERPFSFPEIRRSALATGVRVCTVEHRQVPLIAGISFEIIKFAGRNRRRRWVRTIMFPGLQLQKLTTREPDLDQLAVAVAAMQAVLATETPGLTAADLVGVEVVA